MALLVRREVIVPYLGYGKVLADVERETDTWMGLYAGDDACIGVVNTQVRPEVRDDERGQSLRFWSKIEMTVLSFPTEVRLNGNAWASLKRGLREFDFSIVSEAHKIHIAATIDEGVLKGEIQTGGEVLPLEIPVGDNLLLSSDLGTAALNVPGIEVGEEIFIDTFDPMTLSVTKAKIECIGEESIRYGDKDVLTKVFVTHVGGFTSKAWVSADEEVLRAETPFGFILKKITQEQAVTEMRPRDAESVISLMSIRPTGKTPQRGALWMRLGIENMPAETELPVDDTQLRGGLGRYIIRIPENPVVEGRVLPDVEKAEYTESDTFVQSSHPKIVAMSKEIVGDEQDPWQRAMRIYQWVYDNIDKVPVMSLPSALEVLKSKEGDCNEHTVLFTALARAAGIPARIAIGIVWSDELAGFYYHAWPEVYMGRWTWMDPTLGQPMADATHIKLLTGSIEKWSQLLPYLGKLQIEIVDIGYTREPASETSETP
ncbi:MAG: Transglutaminase protein [Candidatus Hydrogenedentes bacterium]|nr:Transglutaminase protein [Candidatus Hydrogenedentota bacterium]